MSFEATLMEEIKPNFRVFFNEMTRAIDTCKDAAQKVALKAALTQHSKSLFAALEEVVKGFDLSEQLEDEDINYILEHKDDYSPNTSAVETMVDTVRDHGYIIFESDSIVTDMKIEAFAEELKNNPYQLNLAV